MPINEIENYPEAAFENIKHISKKGIEYWFARELQAVLEYDEWRNLRTVIDKAKTACENSGNIASEHFVDVNKTIKMPKGATKKIPDYALTRYKLF